MQAAAHLWENRLRPATTVTGKRSLTLEDCRSLALVKNLDLHVARYEQITKAAIIDSNGKKLLPHLVLASELGQRDNYAYSFSDVLGQEGLNPNPAVPTTGAGVTNYSVGHERSTWRYSLELNWSPTDAALAYYLTKSSRNDTIRAQCQKIRVAQKLIGTVEAAFHRLLGLQQRVSLGRKLVNMRSEVMDQTKRLHDKKLKSVEDLHRARQHSLKAGRLLLSIEDDLEKQRNTLASALSLSPDRCTDGGIYVDGLLGKPRYCEGIPEMEMKAIRNRPEASEAGLNAENSIHDVKRTMIKYFPKVTGFWRYTRDKDRFLYNKDWKDVGFRTYFDLGDWLTNLDESRAARSSSIKAEYGAAAVAVGIAAQVRTAALTYFRTVRELQQAEVALKSARNVLDSAKVKALNNDLNKLALLEAEADAIEEEIERIRTLADANAALAELCAIMGTNYNEPLS